MAKKALFVWGGWDGHTPKQSVDVFAPFLEKQGYDVEISSALDSYLDEAKMQALDLVIPTWTMGEITGDQLKGLLGAVRSGVGCAGWHGCLCDSFRQNVNYQWMTGGQWVAHPGGCIPSYTVNITDKKHPITKGISDFVLPDTEQYYMHVDPALHVLATTKFSGEHGDQDLYTAGTVMPYAWTKTWGKGRVFYVSWGHTNKDFDVPEARKIVERGLLWASK